MRKMKQNSLVRGGAILVLLATAGSVPLLAQLDLTGTWSPRFHEDQPERIPGPEIGDYLGLPISPAARQFALSWNASRITLPEEQCQVHVSPYIYRGPLNVRIWEERDPESQQVVAIRNYISTYEQTRTIWMDGRPHPPEYAPHTWMGFSTGKWEGAVLTVATDHIKQDWIRRNGVLESDMASMNEHFIRHGDILTHVVIVSDPGYLEEPFIRSQDFVFDPNFQGVWTWPCRSAEEVFRPKGQVPQYALGDNPDAKAFTVAHPEIPAEAAMGGKETMYPEYRLKIKAMMAKQSANGSAVAAK
jgi:hypothetical protein